VLTVFSNLTDEQRIEARYDFRICVCRGYDEATKPKLPKRKMKQ